MVKYVYAYQIAKAEAKEMITGTNQTSAMTENNNPGFSKSDLNAIHFQKRGYKGDKKEIDRESKPKVECFRCGRFGHMSRDSCCPALEKNCTKCGIKGI